MRQALLLQLSPLLFLGVSCALPANDTNFITSDNGQWALRRRTQMKFDIDDLRDDCFGVRMRSLGSALGTPSATKEGFRDQVGPPECERYAESRSRTGLYYTAKPPAVHPSTTPREMSLVWKSEKEVRAANALSPGAYTCDHVLEISMVLDVLHARGGVCEAAKARHDAGVSDNAKQVIQRDMQRNIMKIRDIINNKPNLIFFQERIEDIKTENKKNFNRNNRRRAGSNDMDYMAMADYLLRKTSVQSVADRIDAKIAELFGEDVAKAASMGELWRDYIMFTRAIENDVKKSIEAQVNKLKKEKDEVQKGKDECAPKPGPAGPWGKPHPPWGNPGPGKARSASRSSGNSVARRVTRRQKQTPRLHRRAPAVRGASRSGPHAPPARSCPLPGHQPKPIVPRSKLQTKPAPAKRPRVPTQKPPVKAQRARKVVPRPANRPRRAIGKPAPPKKRVTPKKQPKRAPKPPNKPKGKPRPRKRK